MGLDPEPVPVASDPEPVPVGAPVPLESDLPGPVAEPVADWLESSPSGDSELEGEDPPLAIWKRC